MSTATDPLITAQRRFIELRKQKDELDKQLKAVKATLQGMELTIAEQMAAIGQSHTILDGVRLQVRTQRRIGKRGTVEMQILCERLKGMEDLAFLVKDYVHSNSLQSALKEILDDTGTLPEEVAELVNVYEQTLLFTTKA